jgi:hypothetical protein
MELPYEILYYICDFCMLKERYRWSLCSKEFSIKTWCLFCRRFKARDRLHLKDVLLRECASSFEKRFNHIWSNHLCEPLRLWTPWTTGKYCSRGTKYCKIFFRNITYVDFARSLVEQFNLHFSFRARRGDLGVAIYIWDKAVPMVYLPRNERKIHMSSAFKMKPTDLTRALVEYRLYNDKLRLHVLKLEFLISS